MARAACSARMQRKEQVGDGGGRLAVEAAGRLVAEQKTGLVDQGARHGHALAFAAGQLGGAVV